MQFYRPRLRLKREILHSRVNIYSTASVDNILLYDLKNNKVVRITIRQVLHDEKAVTAIHELLRSTLNKIVHQILQN